MRPTSVIALCLLASAHVAEALLARPAAVQTTLNSTSLRSDSSRAVRSSAPPSNGSSLTANASRSNVTSALHLAHVEGRSNATAVAPNASSAPRSKTTGARATANVSLSAGRKPLIASNPHDFMMMPTVWKMSNYSERAAAMRKKCVKYPACVGLCAWIRDELKAKYGEIPACMKAGDANGDGAVDAMEFLEQCKAAGISDEALSARSYIILYLIDIDADGFVSEESYNRVFSIASDAEKEGVEKVNKDDIARKLKKDLKRVQRSVTKEGDDYLENEQPDFEEDDEPEVEVEEPRENPGAATTTHAPQSAARGASVGGVVAGLVIALAASL